MFNGEYKEGHGTGGATYGALLGYEFTHHPDDTDLSDSIKKRKVCPGKRHIN